MPKIFFSYARADSEFVLRLASDLRSASISLWIDQLDIRPGDRWDSSVENALVASPCLLVVLSPASVASQNVMDEVAFALANKKKVVPVLHQRCEIPFRLQRLQYIDFTATYEHGFTQLLAALNALQQSPTTETGAPQASASAALSGNHDPALRISTKRLTYGIAAGLLAAVIGLGYWIYDSRTTSAPIATYHVYRNERLGYSLPYPTDLLSPQGEAADGSGQRFASKNNRTFLIVTGFRGRSPTDLRDLYVKQSRSAPPENPTRMVTYKVEKDTWFVVSGYEQQRVWYEKAVIAKDTLAYFHIEYDASEKQVFDPVVEKIAKSFAVSPE